MQAENGCLLAVNAIGINGVDVMMSASPFTQPIFEYTAVLLLQQFLSLAVFTVLDRYVELIMVFYYPVAFYGSS